MEKFSPGGSNSEPLPALGERMSPAFHSLHMEAEAAMSPKQHSLTPGGAVICNICYWLCKRTLISACNHFLDTVCINLECFSNVYFQSKGLRRYFCELFGHQQKDHETQMVLQILFVPRSTQYLPTSTTLKLCVWSSTECNQSNYACHHYRSSPVKIPFPFLFAFRYYLLQRCRITGAAGKPCTVNLFRLAKKPKMFHEALHKDFSLGWVLGTVNNDQPVYIRWTKCHL